MSGKSAPGTNLRIASCPGAESAGNDYLRLFCQSLRDQGATVESIWDPREISGNEMDVLVLHWPERIFWNDCWSRWMLRRSYETLRAIQRIRRAGVKVVWVLHNLHPHEATLGLRLNWAAHRRMLCRLVDGFITLSPSTIDVVRKKVSGLAKTPAVFVWHPPYPVHSAADKIDSRNEFLLPVNAMVFGYFGYLRHYKGLETAVEAFRKLTGSQYRLLIGGEPHPDLYANEIAARSAGDERITLIAHRLSDRELAALLEASDIVVLPFKEYLHSGSIIHALCQRRTVLTPETPYAKDLQQLVGADWIQTYTPPLTDEILRSAHPAQGLPRLDFLSMEESGARLIEFFKHLLGDPIRHQPTQG